MSRFQLRPREYEELEVLAERSPDAIVVRRAHALLGLHEGLPAAEIGEILGVTRQSVYNWAQAFADRSELDLTERLRDAPRSGRPPTALGIIDPLVEAVLDDDPRDYGYRATVWTAPLLQRYLGEVHAIAASRKSVSRAIARLGVRWKRPRHRLGLRPDTWRQAKGGSKPA
jgi:transposase